MIIWDNLDIFYHTKVTWCDSMSYCFLKLIVFQCVFDQVLSEDIETAFITRKLWQLAGIV